MQLLTVIVFPRREKCKRFAPGCKVSFGSVVRRRGTSGAMTSSVAIVTPLCPRRLSTVVEEVEKTSVRCEDDDSFGSNATGEEVHLHLLTLNASA